MVLTDKLTNIADAIRAKTGVTNKLSLDEMVAAIGGIGNCYCGTENLIVGQSALATDALYFFISDSDRKVQNVYLGVNGIAEVWRTYNRVEVGRLEIGSSVFMKVNGVRTEFLVVNQGIPDATMYDASCNGTWLLMKGLYKKMVWDSSDNDYENSDIHAYLNGTFLGLFNSDIQTAIKQVKLPHHKGTGSDGAIADGTRGLSAKIFLLSGYEVGWTTSDSGFFPVDGACLNYFSGTSQTDSKRIGYYEGTATEWWLRSPRTSNIVAVSCVRPDGFYGGKDYGNSYGIRPAFILPSDTLADTEFNIIA